MAFIEGLAGRLWVEVLGAGDPVSVFAHGVTSSVAELRPMAARTAGTRVLFDFRGHGRSDSPPPEAGYNHQAMRADLETVADHFAATQAFGTSMGAGALLNLIGDKPERFERLVFFIPASIDRLNPGAGGFPAVAAMLEQMPLAQVADRLAADPSRAPLFERRPWWRNLVRQRTMRMNATGVPRALRAYADGGPPLADGGVLRRVRAPALILAHEGDPVHDAAVARRLAALLPDAELRVWPEPLAMLDDWNAFARLIGAFLAGEPLCGPPEDRVRGADAGRGRP